MTYDLTWKPLRSVNSSPSVFWTSVEILTASSKLISFLMSTKLNMSRLLPSVPVIRIHVCHWQGSICQLKLVFPDKIMVSKLINYYHVPNLTCCSTGIFCCLFGLILYLVMFCISLISSLFTWVCSCL